MISQNDNLRESRSYYNQQNKQIKQPQQLKALFMKNIRLQSKQKCTNVCQILTPILCLLFTYLMKTIAQQNITTDILLQNLQYPIKFNDWNLFDIQNPTLRQKLQWMYYSCQDKCDKNILGNNDGQSNPTGMLQKIKKTYTQKYNYHFDPINKPNQTIKKNIPFFININQTKQKNINSKLYSTLQWIAQNDMDYLKNISGYQIIPDGAINISRLSNQSIQFDIKVNDIRQVQIIRDNGISKITTFRWAKNDSKQLIFPQTQMTSYVGMLTLLNWITSSFIQTITQKTMQSGVYFMPQDQNGISFIDTFINLAAVLIFPLSLSLMFPVFLYTIVLEKQQRLIQMMKMNGMKISSYWFVYFLFNFTISLVSNIIFYIIGYYLTQMRFFTQTSFALMSVIMIGWSLAQIGMAVFFQTFLSKSAAANIIGYLFSIWTSMIASTLSIGIYMYPMQFPNLIKIFAPLGFPRIFYLMLTACSSGNCYGSIQHIPSQMKIQITFLYVNFIVFFILGAYLFQIVPQQFGITRSPLFPIKALLNLLKLRKKNQYQIHDDEQKDIYIKKGDQDSFSRNQRRNILQQQDVVTKNPLVINNLRKLYYKQTQKQVYAAVKSLNLKIGKTQTFGLLGPNGAGKTTLISMLTGMYQPDYGNAWIGSYDIKNNVQKAQLQMGVCPQFDLLWPQLTVQQHLYFYARLKGIPRNDIQLKVSLAIQQVNLTRFRKFVSSSLSGGMKRRLSVAISLVGNPKIVFLDQPSTGLDPDNRRQLWQVLSACKNKRAVFITTHMMQQAQALCDRIGILTKGVLRTVSNQIALKKIYGGGYRISISLSRKQKKLINQQTLLLNNDRMQDYNNQNNKQLQESVKSFIQAQDHEQQNKQKINKIFNFMNQTFDGCQIMKKYNDYLIYKVPSKFKVSQMFQILSKMQKQLGIADVAITNSSLQDVFMNVVSNNQLDDEHINNKNQHLKKSQSSFVSKNRQSLMSGNSSSQKKIKN